VLAFPGKKFCPQVIGFRSSSPCQTAPMWLNMTPTDSTYLRPLNPLDRRATPFGGAVWASNVSASIARTVAKPLRMYFLDAVMGSTEASSRNFQYLGAFDTPSASLANCLTSWRTGERTSA
jgi:hypothetical protein